MRHCSICAVVSLVAFCAGGSSALDVKKRDGIHRVEKIHVTILDNIQRRDTTACPTSYLLCPSSASGGCCPEGFGCATDSCFASTRAPQTCQGRAGYYPCAPDLEGGCCPEGYLCQRGAQCVVPDGVSYSQSCPTNYFLCPSSLNYGCCRDGMGCAASACYSTEPSTYKITRTVTTTNADDEEVTVTETATTVSTPSQPTVYPTGAIGQGDQQVVVKFYPTSVPKVEPEVTKDDDDGGSGLSTGAIVGIVVGVVGLLIIVVAAAFIILRHLNKVVKTVVESKQGTSTGSRAAKPKPFVSQYRVADKPTPSEIDEMSVDPLMITSPRPSTRRLDSDSSGAIGLGVGVGSPGYPSPPLDTPSPNAPAGYQAVPTTTAERHASYDSTFQGGVGYFNMPSEQERRRPSQQSGIWPWPSGAQPQRQSTDSQTTQQAYAQGHGRQWSNASEQSNPSDMVSPIHQHFGAQELDSANAMVPELHAQSAPSTYPPESPVDPRRSMVSAMSSTVASTRQPAPHPRRRSGEGRTHSDSVTAAQAPLSVVTEDTELIGHYGPPDSAVGQTAAGHEDGVQEMAGSQGWDQPQQQK
ncbi:hypothetical protein BN1723_016264 [Verticillium longisporum]|uniref:Mid2 domain-containing protein n=1 Tax=Verticillium longisporum TaxID=100787 RepID=A0A0G4NB81_VERLO|nr:hypothetical protein BN1723_016264 [Verticillium longisporum]